MSTEKYQRRYRRGFACYGRILTRFLRYGRSLVRFYVLWRIIRAPRRGFRHIFLRTFCVSAMHCLHAKTGVPAHFFARFLCALVHWLHATQGGSTFLRVFFIFVGGFARFGAILAKRRRREEANSEKTSPIRKQKAKKTKKRGEGVKKVNAKEKEKVKDSERESMKKRRTKSDAPL